MRLPSLNRLPTEIGREERTCEACGETSEQILYLVPKKIVFVYIKDYPENAHATCLRCAHSEVLTGDERDRALSRNAGEATSEV